MYTFLQSLNVFKSKVWFNVFFWMAKNETLLLAGDGCSDTFNMCLCLFSTAGDDLTLLLSSLKYLLDCERGVAGERLSADAGDTERRRAADNLYKTTRSSKIVIIYCKDKSNYHFSCLTANGAFLDLSNICPHHDCWVLTSFDWTLILTLFAPVCEKIYTIFETIALNERVAHPQ